MFSNPASTDATYALVGCLSRSWGDHGYRIAIAGIGFGAAVAECWAGDGSVFYLAADRWGNVAGGSRTSGYDTADAAVAALASVAS